MCLMTLLAASPGAVVGSPAKKRMVVLRFDGLPPYLIDEYIDQTDPATGKPFLPWIKHIFYERGARLNRFFTRGLSVSGSSWTSLMSGQDLVIKSNVEFDRATTRVEDYLNIVRYYYDYTKKQSKWESRAVEVLDEAGIPLAADAYDQQQRYIAASMFQRGIQWGELLIPLKAKFTTQPRDLVGDFLLGFDWHEYYLGEWERKMIAKIEHSDELYIDYYNPIFDETLHGDRSRETARRVLKEVDLFIGRVYTAVLRSPLANDTVLVVVSDHGFNRDDSKYSQGFNLGRYLLTREFGAHHLLTKRYILSAYAYKTTFTPFASEATTESSQSYYLKGRKEYVTAALDYDGNERAALLLRNADWNRLHMLWGALRQPQLGPDMRATLAGEFFDIAEAAKPVWRQELRGLDEEIAALSRKAEETRSEFERVRKKVSVPVWRKLKAKAENFELYANSYRRYSRALHLLLGIQRPDFDFAKMRIEDFIPPHSLGPRNTAGDLLAYPVALNPDGSFLTIDYPELLASQKVRNNVQPGISPQPVDFMAHRIPYAEISGSLKAAGLDIAQDVVWLYGDRQHQAFLLLELSPDGTRRLRYVPVRNVHSPKAGQVAFEVANFEEGFPLHLWEDSSFVVNGSRLQFLENFHTEAEWRQALASTRYALSVTGLYALLERPDRYYETFKTQSEDDRLVERFYNRSRNHTEPDLHILASDGWNFDVKGFNPGGNHGSLFQKSLRSTLMFWGGDHINIARGKAVDEPYDTLSFLPTLFEAAGLLNGGHLAPSLIERGFRPFPGGIIWEVFKNARK